MLSEQNELPAAVTVCLSISALTQYHCLVHRCSHVMWRRISCLFSGKEWKISKWGASSAAGVKKHTPSNYNNPPLAWLSPRTYILCLGSGRSPALTFLTSLSFSVCAESLWTPLCWPVRPLTLKHHLTQMLRSWEARGSRGEMPDSPVSVSPRLQTAEAFILTDGRINGWTGFDWI